MRVPAPRLSSFRRSDAAGFTFIGALAGLAFAGTLAAVVVPLIARRLSTRTPVITAATVQKVAGDITRGLEVIGSAATAYAGRVAAQRPAPAEPAAVPDQGPAAPPPAEGFWEMPAPRLLFPRERPEPYFWPPLWVRPVPWDWPRRHPRVRPGWRRH